MPLAYISLGSNLGDRAGNLTHAIRRLRAAGLDVQRLSQIYETEPVDTFPQPEFFNMIAAIRVEDGNTPEELLTQLLQIEQQLGRTREVDKAPRAIDLDLLFFGNEIRATEFLRLPHPRLHERRFVLVPLNELDPNLEHPVFRKTVKELLQQTADRSGVRRAAVGGDLI